LTGQERCTPPCLRISGPVFHGRPPPRSIASLPRRPVAPRQVSRVRMSRVPLAGLATDPRAARARWRAPHALSPCPGRGQEKTGSAEMGRGRGRGTAGRVRGAVRPQAQNRRAGCGKPPQPPACFQIFQNYLKIPPGPPVLSWFSVQRPPKIGPGLPSLPGLRPGAGSSGLRPKAHRMRILGTTKVRGLSRGGWNWPGLRCLHLGPGCDTLAGFAGMSLGRLPGTVAALALGVDSSQWPHEPS
jgi:hypothetical protein